MFDVILCNKEVSTVQSIKVVAKKVFFKLQKVELEVNPLLHTGHYSVRMTKISI